MRLQCCCKQWCCVCIRPRRPSRNHGNQNLWGDLYLDTMPRARGRFDVVRRFIPSSNSQALSNSDLAQSGTSSRLRLRKFRKGAICGHLLSEILILDAAVFSGDVSNNCPRNSVRPAGRKRSGRSAGTRSLVRSRPLSVLNNIETRHRSRGHAPARLI